MEDSLLPFLFPFLVQLVPFLFHGTQGGMKDSLLCGTQGGLVDSLLPFLVLLLPFLLHENPVKDG